MRDFEKMIRDRAYELWKHAGRPSDRSDDIWFAARAEFSLSATELEPTSRAPKRPSVRPVKGSTHSFKPRWSSEPLPAESTSLADELSAGSGQLNGARSDEGIGVSLTDPTTALSQVIGGSGGPTLRAKAKQRDKMPISRDHGRATPLLNSQRSTTVTNSPATPLSSVDERSPQRRKRTIMARYVFDDELKPGAHWKRRLLGMR